MGLAVIQVLRARGAGKILVSEVSSRRQELAQHFGADYILDPTKQDAVQICKTACGDEGPALVFDAAGVQPGLDLALAASRTGATIVNIATWKTQPLINSVPFIMGEKNYIGTMVYVKEDFDQVMEAMESGKSTSVNVMMCEPLNTKMLAGALQPTPMITDVVPLDKVIEDGFQRLLSGKDNLVKVLVRV